MYTKEKNYQPKLLSKVSKKEKTGKCFDCFFVKKKGAIKIKNIDMDIGFCTECEKKKMVIQRRKSNNEHQRER